MSGNIFKDENGRSTTQRIVQSDVRPTLTWLGFQIHLPLLENLLGSVGKKASSGDIDIAVDQSLITKDDLIQRLDVLSTNLGYEPSAHVRKNGICVHFKSPISGDMRNGFVQVDFMFGDDIPFMRFSLFSAGDLSAFSGADRNLFMSSIAKSLPGDLKYSWQKGLIRRSDGELISKDPDTISQVLLGTGHRRESLDSIESILSIITKDSARMQALRTLAIELRRLEGKKPGQAKIDCEEADRIERILGS